MCYSAQIQADYRKYVKTFGAHMDIEEFARLYFERAEGSKVKIPKAVDDAFRDPQTDEERQIKAANLASDLPFSCLSYRELSMRLSNL